MRTESKIAGVALALAAAALWGTTGTAHSFASGELSPLWFGALRLVVAAGFFAAYLAFTRGALHARLPAGPVLAAGACMAVYNLAFFAGIRHTGVAIGTAVALGSGPVWAGVLQATITGRIPAPGWWAGTLVAIAGGVLMTARDASGAGATGIGLCLLSGLSYAAYTLFSKRLVSNVPVERVTFPVFALAAALALPAAWLDAGAPVVRAADAAAIAYVGVASAGLAYLLFTHALRHISAATGVTLALGEPVVAFVLAVLVVGERPSVHAVLGLVLVIAGVLAVVRSELRAGGPRLGTTSFSGAAAAGHDARMNDKTERTRTRESIERNKRPLIIYFLIAITGIIGWLSTL